MKANISYIYYGGVAEKLGLAERNTAKTIQSIWEEEIFSRIHPDDLQEKHLQERMANPALGIGICFKSPYCSVPK